MIDLSVKSKTIKLLEKNVYDFGLSKTNFKYDAKGTIIKENTDKFEFVRIKIVCLLKDTVNKMERQATDWEKFLQNVYT